MRLGFAGGDFGYAIDFGLPASGRGTAFALDPEIKRESIWSGLVLRPAALLCGRGNSAVRTRDQDGRWSTTPRSGRMTAC